MKRLILATMMVCCFAFTAFAADDPYRDRVLDITASARQAVAVTPSDTVDIAIVPRGGLFVGVEGDIAVIMADGSEAVTFKGVVGFVPLMVKRVLVTGTTASSIVALY